jgi:D-aspartate ligase
VANIDLRYDIKDDMLKVIEINPRYWGTLFGSYLSGVNFPYDHYMASINRKILDSKYRQIKYLTLQGFIKTLKNNIFIIFQIAFIWHNTPFKFIFLEPKLTVVRLFKIFKRFFNSIF